MAGMMTCRNGFGRHLIRSMLRVGMRWGGGGKSLADMAPLSCVSTRRYAQVRLENSKMWCKSELRISTCLSRTHHIHRPAYTLRVSSYDHCAAVKVAWPMARNSFDLFMNGGHHEQHTDKVAVGQKKKRRNGAKPRAAHEPVRAPSPAFVKDIAAVCKLPFGAGGLLAPQYWRISAGRSPDVLPRVRKHVENTVVVPGDGSGTVASHLSAAGTVASSICARQLMPLTVLLPHSPVARVPGGGIVRVQRFGGGT